MQVPIDLQGVILDRQELADLSDDDSDPPHMDNSQDNRNTAQDSKIPLKEQLQKDPYVQLAVHLMSAPLFATTTTK